MPKIKTMSSKQQEMMTWWFDPATENKKYIIAYGSIRAGKTLSMSISFLCWTFANFNHAKFIVAGQSVDSVRQNVMDNLELFAKSIGMYVNDNGSNNTVVFRNGNQWNKFLIFGDPNTASFKHVAGRSTSGCLLDECSLMDKKFFDMVTSRCNVHDTRLNQSSSMPKFWLNCNPKAPTNFIYTDWIQKASQKNGLVMKFLLPDNPSLTPEQIDGYKADYSGVFYKRNILAEWATAEGIVYDTFDKDREVITYKDFKRRTYKHQLNYYCGVDWGFAPGHNNCITVFADDGKNTYLLKEITERERSINHYVNEAKIIRDKIKNITNGRISNVPFYCDSARPDNINEFDVNGLAAYNADKRILKGIEYLTTKINRNHFFVIISGIDQWLNELYEYRWNKRSGKPIKANDDAMDSWRYGELTNHDVQINKHRGNGLQLFKNQF